MKNKIRKIVDDLLDKAPLDFIGTGSYASGRDDERRFNKTKEETINDLYQIAAEGNQEVAKIVADKLTKTFLENSKGTQAVFRERVRQVEGEGFDAAHDDEHADGALTAAAACYVEVAKTAMIRDDAAEYHEHPLYNSGPAHWPWDREWWKPSNDAKRNLEKAAALLIAEWERLDRMEES